MRTALLYLVLVGAPVLGVLAILRVGERITPPAAIGGEWTADSAAGADAATAVRCDGVVERRSVRSALVSQSGTMATAALRDASGATWAEGTITLRPGSALAEGDLTLVGCRSGGVRATLAHGGGPTPRAVTLTTTASHCTDCPPSHVRLVRSGDDARDARPARPAASAGH